jgi:Sigma-70 region 2
MHRTTTTETRTRAVTSVRRRRPGTRRRDQRGASAKGVGARRHRDERHRPARAEIDEAALALLARHGAQILATARRYAATPEDAEDAYQRGLEILLTKAPTTSEEDLVPWLKTVVLRTMSSPIFVGGSACPIPSNRATGREAPPGGASPHPLDDAPVTRRER